MLELHLHLFLFLSLSSRRPSSGGGASTMFQYVHVAKEGQEGTYYTFTLFIFLWGRFSIINFNFALFIVVNIPL